MKKILAALLILVSVTTVCIKEKRDRDIVRIHILAQSDSEEDQNEKIKVRDRVNMYISEPLSKCKTKAEAMEYFNLNLENIKEVAQSVTDKSVTVTLKDEHFPQKTYNDKTYPAGEYTALKINIGKAEGHNWWCVAFPPMCYTSSQGGKTEYRSIIYDFFKGLFK